MDLSEHTEEINQIYKSIGWTERRFDNCHTICQSENGKAVGILRYFTDCKHVCYVADIAIHKDYQGRGYGEMLVKALVNNCRRQFGFDDNKGELTVFAGQTVINFWKKCGFEVDPKGMFYKFDHYEY